MTKPLGFAQATGNSRVFMNMLSLYVNKTIKSGYFES